MNALREADLDTIVDERLGEIIQQTHDYWAELTYKDVLSLTASTPEIIPLETTSRALLMYPDEPEFDESRTLVLNLPHLNGWNSQHYIRAKVFQQIVAPNSRVLIFPNNTFGHQNYNLSNLSDSDKKRLQEGSMAPVGEKHMRTLEYLNGYEPLGSLAISGYSLGGRTALAMANAGSDVLDVTHLNIDEAPSKTGRTGKQLQKDFLASGGLRDLLDAVRETEMTPLISAMRISRLAADLARFAGISITADAKIIREAMTGDIGLPLFSLDKQAVKTKIGFVDGSKLFDPSSLGSNSSGMDVIDIVKYKGPGFHKHASADNVYLHALMANDGINSR